jgi:hypothetical protein
VGGQYFGLRWPIFWSERIACAALGCWHKQSWPLFLVIFPLVLVLGGTDVIKTPEGVVVWFHIFALAVWGGFLSCFQKN